MPPVRPDVDTIAFRLVIVAPGRCGGVNVYGYLHWFADVAGSVFDIELLCNFALPGNLFQRIRAIYCIRKTTVIGQRLG